MPSEIIQWFPGHMAKTRRLITENLKHVDIVIEILDARIPFSSRNPEIDRLTEGKPRLVLLNKASLADAAKTKYWCKRFSSRTVFCLPTDCVTGEGMAKILPTVKEILAEKLEKYQSKGMSGRRLKAMVLGIPNVGKSSLINKLSGNRKAKVVNRPGVTLDKQWFQTGAGLDIMDMPGILWPKFDDKIIGENLAITGAIKDSILNVEEIAYALCTRLRTLYPEMLTARYKLESMEHYEDLSDYDLFELIGKKRGFLISGGEIDTERTANMLLDEFRAAKIGRITLDTDPEQPKKEVENAGIQS
ncbi:MAG: ribosome biogenesis GTPase YlqF [Clostridia bacterium]|nr:ribosome biogenesis GTPase YlqF [Clostridia bacterium]